MELAVEADIYHPHLSDDGNYSDYVPPPRVFQNGLRCGCGARKDHVFDSKSKFTVHIKSKSHQKWLTDLNNNKTNYFTECVRLTDLVNTQKKIIAHLEKELTVKITAIATLTEQLQEKENIEDNKVDLLTFD